MRRRPLLRGGRDGRDAQGLDARVQIAHLFLKRLDEPVLFADLFGELLEAAFLMRGADLEVFYARFHIATVGAERTAAAWRRSRPS